MGGTGSIKLNTGQSFIFGIKFEAWNRFRIELKRLSKLKIKLKSLFICLTIH